MLSKNSYDTVQNAYLGLTNKDHTFIAVKTVRTNGDAHLMTKTLSGHATVVVLLTCVTDTRRRRLLWRNEIVTVDFKEGTQQGDAVSFKLDGRPCNGRLARYLVPLLL